MLEKIMRGFKVKEIHNDPKSHENLISMSKNGKDVSMYHFKGIEACKLYQMNSLSKNFH